jgi:hypothetical protein
MMTRESEDLFPLLNMIGMCSPAGDAGDVPRLRDHFP